MNHPPRPGRATERLVFVDLDQTLIDYDTATRQAVAAFTSADPRWSHLQPATVATAWLESRRHHTLDGSTPLVYQRQRRLTAVATRLSVDHAPTLIQHWVETITTDAVARCRRYPDVNEFLDEVDIAGIITNGDPHTQRAKLTAADLLAEPLIIASIEIGHAKPSPELYRHAAEQAGAQPDQCLMIGDSRTNDHDAALTAGYAGAALIDRSANPAPGTHPTMLTALLHLKESTP